ncbi:MAG: hypothetical protein NTX64_11690, partial [Elusimicrobia bacterium]|nr:hypothetical protein [Elusimicrobiota bacterium]
MRKFAEAEERRLFELETVRTWRRSGLVSGEEAAALEEELGAAPRIAGWAVRAVLFALTLLAQGALWLFLFRERTWADAGLPLLLLAAVYTALAELLIPRLKVYRFGAEEALIFGAAFDLAFGCGLLIHARRPLLEAGFVFGVPAFVACLCVFARYGYQWAALAAIPCAASIIFTAHISPNAARLASASLCLLVLALTGGGAVADFRRSAWQTFQAALFLAAYLLLNLRLEALIDPLLPAAKTAFYWCTFAATWALPLGALAVGVKRRHRALLDAGVVTLLISVATLKPYLQAARHAWDPALLGALLLAAAALIGRRLRELPEERRRGFTAKRLL